MLTEYVLYLLYEDLLTRILVSSGMNLALTLIWPFSGVNLTALPIILTSIWVILASSISTRLGIFFPIFKLMFTFFS